MKKLFIVMLAVFMLTGCIKDESLDKITYTTYYPLEYATGYIYGEFSEVKSIYPSGVDISTYELTDKQKNIYASADTFVYSGVTNEIKLAADFLNTNENLNIIDGTKGLSYSNDLSELWLDPSNYLMVARNIKSTLIDYTDSVYDEEKIEKYYDELKIKISELDVELTMMGKNASDKNIFVTDNTFNFLTKYNINVISVDEDNESNTKAYNDAKLLINNKDIKYVYTIKGKELSNEINTFIKNYKLEIIEIDPLYTISEEQRKNGEDYITIMNANIEKFKTELFK